MSRFDPPPFPLYNLCVHREHCGFYEPADCSVAFARTCHNAAYWRGELDGEGREIPKAARIFINCRFAGCPGEEAAK